MKSNPIIIIIITITINTIHSTDSSPSGSSSTIEEPENETEIVIDIPENKTSNQSVEFNVSEIKGFDDENLSYYWDFGDGTNGTGKQPSHTYTLPGTYIVVLKIYDNNGTLVNTTTFEVTIYPEGGIPSQGSKKDDRHETDSFLILIGAFGGIIVIVVLFVLFRRLKKVKNNEFRRFNP